MKHVFKRTHITATPFDNPHIKRIIDEEIRVQTNRVKKKIRVCDPFARESWLTTKPQGIIGITNDLNPEMPTDYHMEARDFAKKMYDDGEEFDLILFDPPYNLSQLKRQYDGMGKDLELWQTLNPFGECKNYLAGCLAAGGSIISFGFGSRAFGTYRNMQRIAIYNFEPSGTEWRYNIQVVVERRLQRSLTSFEPIVGIEEE